MERTEHVAWERHEKWPSQLKNWRWWWCVTLLELSTVSFSEVHTGPELKGRHLKLQNIVCSLLKIPATLRMANSTKKIKANIYYCTDYKIHLRPRRFGIRWCLPTTRRRIRAKSTKRNYIKATVKQIPSMQCKFDPTDRYLQWNRLFLVVRVLYQPIYIHHTKSSLSMLQEANRKFLVLFFAVTFRYLNL